MCPRNAPPALYFQVMEDFLGCWLIKHPVHGRKTPNRSSTAVLGHSYVPRTGHKTITGQKHERAKMLRYVVRVMLLYMLYVKVADNIEPRPQEEITII